MKDEFNLGIDDSRFQRAFAELSKTSKRSPIDLMMAQAKGFVKRVIAITPPMQGTIGSDAKDHAAALINYDLRKIFSPGSPEFLDRFERFYGGPVANELWGHQGAAGLGFVYTRILRRDEMEKWHQDRKNSQGRVSSVEGKIWKSGSGRDLSNTSTNRERAQRLTTGVRSRDLHLLDIGLVKNSDFSWFKNKVAKRIGKLASGWNRSAELLGYRPPAWVRRHGNDRGRCQITIRDGSITITLINASRYADEVKGLARRVQEALDHQAAAIERRLDFYKKDAAAAGFAVK